MRIMSNNRVQNFAPYCSIYGWYVHFHTQLLLSKLDFGLQLLKQTEEIGFGKKKMVLAIAVY